MANDPVDPDPDPPVPDGTLLARLGGQLAELSRELTTGDGPGLDPDRVIALAAEAIPGGHHAGITLLRPGHLPRSIAATDRMPRRVVQIHHATGECPCLDACDGHATVLTGSLDSDPRWPTFGPRCVTTTGVRSMLSLHLGLVAGDRAAMTFYSEQPDAFGDEQVAVASVFSLFAALAVEQTLRRRDSVQLRAALTSREEIGTAVGIIMARHLVSPQQAFEQLRTASQVLNRKLREIAVEVAHTGEIPTRPGDPTSPARGGAAGDGPARRPGPDRRGRGQ